MQSLARTLVLAVTAGLGLSSCANLFHKDEGLKQVDDLLVRIERVHVETELSRSRADAAVERLAAMANSEFGEEYADEAFRTLMETIDASVAQADRLRASVAPMEAAAASLFENWRGDLDEFSNERLRKHSQARLEKTRRRYATITAALEPTQVALDAFNLELQDHALFLSNDFNATSLRALGSQVQMLEEQSQKLDELFQGSMNTTLAYLRWAALPMPPTAPQEGADAPVATGQTASAR